MNVLILVVTYNRKPILSQCLQAIFSQTYSNFRILVVDNGSTDGTRTYLSSLEETGKISALFLNKNLGGAGGFSAGMKEAMRLGYSHIWMMDDDTIPTPNALEKLICADQLLSSYGFLVSLPVWKDGSLCKMNLPLLGSVFSEPAAILESGLIPVKKATFVSFFIRSDIIRQLGLPIKEFFLWGDDQEYTERISTKYPSYLVTGSIVLHLMNSNVGSDLSSDSSIRISRYFYAYRNELYISKKKGILSLGYYFFRAFLIFFKIIFFAPDQRLSRIHFLCRGIISGIFFHPEIEFYANPPFD